jgi:C-terminal processing protease CtpA/Prc
VTRSSVAGLAGATVRALGAVLLVTALSHCGPSKGTIGAVLSRGPDGRLFVREVPEGLAAAQGGVAPGDEILLIDGRDARALGPKGLHEALSGTVGERVKLTLVRRGEIVRVTLNRTKAEKYRVSPDSSGGTPE